MATQQPQRGGAGKPGAMTMAMQAVKTVSGPKVLRIGVLQGGRIIEERVIRNRDTVSVGTTERNTFTVSGANMPGHHELFQMAGGSYRLNFNDAMDGRIALPQGMKTLPQLKQEGQAVKSNVGWQVPLNEQCRGKVTVGDTTFLFQFVAPPPPQPTPQLPAAIRAGWVKNIDWTYNACLAFFLVIAFSSIAYVEYLYDPEIEDTFALDARLVTLVQPPAAIEPEAPPPPETSASAPDPNQQAAPTAAPTRQASQAPAQSAAARAQAAVARADRATAAAERAAQAALNALSNNAELALLTGSLDTGHGSAADRLQAGGLMQGSVDALANTGGIQAANGQGGGLRRSGLAASAGGLAGGGRGLGGGREISGGGGAIGGGGEVVQERVVRGNVSLGGGGDSEGGEGTLDSNAIASGVRRSISGIRSCYERSLRNNPQLSGRLEVRFTIGGAGRVTAASTSGLDAAPEVGSCIAGVVRRIVFPAPTGGSVETSFSFNFAPGG